MKSRRRGAEGEGGVAGEAGAEEGAGAREAGGEKKEQEQDEEQEQEEEKDKLKEEEQEKRRRSRKRRRRFTYWECFAAKTQLDNDWLTKRPAGSDLIARKRRANIRRCLRSKQHQASHLEDREPLLLHATSPSKERSCNCITFSLCLVS
jgi:hypothetical protein